MQRWTMALVAVFSFFLFNILHLPVAGAQSHLIETPKESEESKVSTPEVVTHKSVAINGTVLVKAEETVVSVDAANKRVIIQGHVLKDVVTNNCVVTIESGAHIDGALITSGGTLECRATGGNMHGSKNTSLHPHITDAKQLQFLADQQSLNSMEGMARSHSQDWTGGQFALLLLGLMSGLIGLVAAPRATQQASQVIGVEPGRCLAFGAVGLGAMLFLLSISAGLLDSPLRFLWLPFGALLGLVSCVALTFGWLCGARQIGYLLARKFGKGDSRALYFNIAIGLGAFFLLNVFLGKINVGLGVMGMLLEFVVAVLGLGAAIVTGFGADPDWLTLRMRGDVRWFARSPRI